MSIIISYNMLRNDFARQFIIREDIPLQTGANRPQYHVENRRYPGDVWLLLTTRSLRVKLLQLPAFPAAIQALDLDLYTLHGTCL